MDYNEDDYFDLDQYENDPNELLPDIAGTTDLIWCFGKNNYGELSQKHTRNLLEPKPLKTLKNERAVTISSGRDHSALVDGQGNLYLCGSSLLGKLG